MTPVCRREVKASFLSLYNRRRVVTDTKVDGEKVPTRCCFCKRDKGNKSKNHVIDYDTEIMIQNSFKEAMETTNESQQPIADNGVHRKKFQM